MAERCPACMTDSACRAAACHNRRRRGFLQARPPQGVCSQRVFLGARRNRPRPRHMPCSLQIGGRLLWTGRTHFQKCTAGCLAGGRRTDSFTGRLHRRGPSCLFPPKQKRLPRGQNQSRTAGVCLLLSASAAAHEGGNRLSARWKKAIPAQTVYRKKPPSENGRFWTITASKILTGQRQRGFTKQNTRL